MKTTFSIIIAVILFLFLARTTIEFHPFKVIFSRIFYAIGFIFVMIGILFIEFQGKENGRAMGINDIKEVLIELRQEEKMKGQENPEMDESKLFNRSVLKEKMKRPDECPSCRLIHPLVREFGLCGKCAEEQY